MGIAFGPSLDPRFWVWSAHDLDAKHLDLVESSQLVHMVRSEKCAKKMCILTWYRTFSLSLKLKEAFGRLLPPVPSI